MARKSTSQDDETRRDSRRIGVGEAPSLPDEVVSEGLEERRRNIVTPDRPLLSAEASASSTGSSTSSFDIFDCDSTRGGTPLTPPETPSPAASRRSRYSKNDHFSRRLRGAKEANSYVDNGQISKSSSILLGPSHQTTNGQVDKVTEMMDALDLLDDPTAKAGSITAENYGPERLGPEVESSPTFNKSTRRTQGAVSSSQWVKMNSIATPNRDTMPQKIGSISAKGTEDGRASSASAHDSQSTNESSSLRPGGHGGHMRSHSTPAPLIRETAGANSDVATSNDTHTKTDPPIERQDQSENPHDSIESGDAVSPKPNRRTSRRASTASPQTNQAQRSFGNSTSDPPALISADGTLKPIKGTRKRGSSSSVLQHQSNYGNKEASKSEAVQVSGSHRDTEAPNPPKLQNFHSIVAPINEIKKNILDIIENRGKTKGKKQALYNGDPGFIYIFTSPIYPGHVKIGKTQRKSEDRVRKWATQCKFTCHHVKDLCDRRFRYHSTVEKLVQEELCNDRRKFRCWKCKTGTVHRLNVNDKRGKSDKENLHEGDPEEVEPQEAEPQEGGTDHGEWYEISENRALYVVERWRKWIIEETPYKNDGTLNEQWLWKHGCTNDSTAMVDWDEWVHSSQVETLRYAIHYADKELRDLWPHLMPVLKSAGFLIVMMGIMVWHVLGRGYLGSIFGLASVFVAFSLSIRYG
jgi:hypothetical protein